MEFPSAEPDPAIVEAIRADGRFTAPVSSETLVRGWHVEGLAVRPDHRMVAHTGFLMTARRVADGVEVQPPGDRAGGAVAVAARARPEGVVVGEAAAAAAARVDHHLARPAARPAQRLSVRDRRRAHACAP